MWTRRELGWTFIALLPAACGLRFPRGDGSMDAEVPPDGGAPSTRSEALGHAGLDGPATGELRPEHFRAGSSSSDADADDPAVDDPARPRRPLRGASGVEPGSEPTLEERSAQLRLEYGSEEWTVIEVSPFVVIGDGPADDVKRHARATVRWAVKMLEADYFDQPPASVVTIWLLKDSESYEKQAIALFADRPDTPYGWYSPSANAMIMNIATGGGTLVHEIVHPYMATNFPRCPSWFNEGLASLYEQSSERDGHIVGLLNWRLPGLKSAIKARTLPSFRGLCETGEHFYDRDPGTNYSQARYLCYWLQEQGKLRTFYRDFLAARIKDPTGYATLSSAVGMDMDEFEVHWRAWVTELGPA